MNTLSESELQLKKLLDHAVSTYNTPDFIKEDPISIPHSLSLLQDVEIMGFWTAVLSWGRRQTIIQKATQLLELMDYAPYEFIVQHEEKDLIRFEVFKHRTFQYTDTLHFISFFRHHYSSSESLEDAFLTDTITTDQTTEKALDHFQQYFFSLEDSPRRTQKHVSAPHKKSTCKRINMYLRWMVRQDEQGVDFGLWKRISPSQLLIPLDVHVAKVAHQLGLLDSNTKNHWKTVVTLTEKLRRFDPHDPVKYDFALFGIGVYGMPL